MLEDFKDKVYFEFSNSEITTSQCLQKVYDCNNFCLAIADYVDLQCIEVGFQERLIRFQLDALPG